MIKLKYKMEFTTTDLDDQYKKLKTTKTQKKLFQDMGDCLAKYLEISNITARGFHILSVIEWQQEISMTVNETESKLGTTPESRINQAERILDIFSEKIARVLKIKKKEHLIDLAIEKALAFYAETYANRPPDTD